MTAYPNVFPQRFNLLCVDFSQELILKRKFIPRSQSSSKLNASDDVEGDDVNAVNDANDDGSTKRKNYIINYNRSKKNNSR